MNNTYLEQTIKDLNLKLTRPRLLVAKTILTSFDHMTVDEILRKVRQKYPKIGVATVYRTLNILETNKLIKKNVFSGKPMTYENICDKEHHDHLIDLENDNVIEFCDLKLENIIKKIAEEQGYSLVFHEIKLYGKKK